MQNDRLDQEVTDTMNDELEISVLDCNDVVLCNSIENQQSNNATPQASPDSRSKNRHGIETKDFDFSGSNLTLRFQMTNLKPLEGKNKYSAGVVSGD